MGIGATSAGIAAASASPACSPAAPHPRYRRGRLPRHRGRHPSTWPAASRPRARAGARRGRRGRHARRLPRQRRAPDAGLRTRLVEASVEGELPSGPAWRGCASASSARGVARISRRRSPGSAQHPHPRRGPRPAREPRRPPRRAVGTADSFLRDGRIRQHPRPRAAQPDEVHDATSSKGDWEWPVLVLVDRAERLRRRDCRRRPPGPRPRAIVAPRPTGRARSRRSTSTRTACAEAHASRGTTCLPAAPSTTTAASPPTSRRRRTIPGPGELLRGRIATIPSSPMPGARSSPSSPTASPRTAHAAPIDRRGNAC